MLSPLQKNSVCFTQYRAWLPEQREKLSPEDYSRYCKQLEIMRAMCQVFEDQSTAGPGEGEGEGEGEGGATAGTRGEEPRQNEKIIELMHQV